MHPPHIHGGTVKKRFLINCPTRPNRSLIAPYTLSGKKSVVICLKIRGRNTGKCRDEFKFYTREIDWTEVS